MGLETESNGINDTISSSKNLDGKTTLMMLFLSFLLPVIVAVLAFHKIQISPYGKYTVLIYDMRAQYLPTVTSLRYLKEGINSGLFTLFGALGENALPVYSTYLLNPFAWITTFFGIEQMPDVLYCLTILRFGICGLSFCLYLLYGVRVEKSPVLIVLFSSCYALMSYNVMYSMTPFFIDVVALTPIIILGVENIINEKKGILYVLSLTLALYFYFQLAYMSGIFAVIYLIFRLVQIKKTDIKVVLKFVYCSLLSLGMFMPVFLPVLLNMFRGRIESSNLSSERIVYYSFFKVLKQFVSCQYDTIESGGLPLLFCGTITLIGTITFFIRKEVAIRVKLASVFVIAFYFLSFCFVSLNQIWHGFNEPNSYPVRYSYTFCFFLLLIGYYGLAIFKERVVIPTGICIIVSSFLGLLVLGELYMNSTFVLASNNISMFYGSRNEYDGYIYQLKDAIAHIPEEKELYRLARDYTYTANDGMLMGYNGIGFFSSFYERKFMNFMGMLGYSQNEHILLDYGATPLIESLLGAKYKIVSKQYNSNGYDSIYENNSFKLLKNSNALPIGVMVYDDGVPIKDSKDNVDKMRDKDSFAYQEFFASELIGREVDIFRQIDYSIIDSDTNSGRKVSYEFTADSELPIWLYCKMPEKNDESQGSLRIENKIGRFTANGEDISPFRDAYSTFCVYIGKYEPGEKVVVEADSVMDFGDPWIVYYDEDSANQVLEELKSRALNNARIHDGRLEGSVSVKNGGGTLILSLPYMSGYRILVDGESSLYGGYRDVLTAIPLPPGEHTIEVSYVTPGLIIGTIIGLFTMVVSLLSFWITFKKGIVFEQ